MERLSFGGRQLFADTEDKSETSEPLLSLGRKSGGYRRLGNGDSNGSSECDSFAVSFGFVDLSLDANQFGW